MLRAFVFIFNDIVMVIFLTVSSKDLVYVYFFNEIFEKIFLN